MRSEEVIEVIENEKECVRRAGICDRECQVCDLVRNDEEILEAYDQSIKAIRRLQKIEEMVRKAFSDPDTDNITLHRAQVLANVLAVFEYDLGGEE